MRDFFVKPRMMSEITAVLMIVFGLMLVINPGGAVLLVCRLLGLVLAVTGLVFCLTAFSGRYEPAGKGLDLLHLVPGIFLAAAGLFILFRPGVVVGFAGILFAVILLVHGVSDLRKMLLMRQVGDQRWKISLVSAVITFLMGFIVLIAPFGSASLMMTFAGIFLMIDGISELYLILRMSG
mgnify:FL=1